MIKLGLEAAMGCEEQDCLHALHVDLCLLVTGGFGFRAPAGHGWQVLANPSAGPTAPFLTRCPEHRTRLTAAPAQGLIVTAEPH